MDTKVKKIKNKKFSIRWANKSKTSKIKMSGTRIQHMIMCLDERNIRLVDATVELSHNLKNKYTTLTAYELVE